MVTVAARIRGKLAGTAILDATVDGGGLADRVKHEWTIRPAGEIFLAQNAAWVEQASTLSLPAGSQSTPAQGPGRLVLERGIAPVLAAALDSMSIPLRFALSGTITMPEATARVTDDEAPLAHALARPLIIRD